ncbi:MAG TPA: recombinase family protein [Thermomicrobiales bacterium]|nr:recombinase family protein [Thermomicrobiales bacterium]
MTDTKQRTRVATYERVSTEDRRERETIRTQTEQLERRLSLEEVEMVARYVDDGISGCRRRFREREGGGQLLHDAEAGRFQELWVYHTDRLARNLSDMAATGRCTKSSVSPW